MNSIQPAACQLFQDSQYPATLCKIDRRDFTFANLAENNMKLELLGTLDGLLPFKGP
jgi:hypothetical protein